MLVCPKPHRVLQDIGLETGESWSFKPRGMWPLELEALPPPLVTLQDVLAQTKRLE